MNTSIKIKQLITHCKPLKILIVVLHVKINLKFRKSDPLISLYVEILDRGGLLTKPMSRKEDTRIEDIRLNTVVS